MPDPDPALNHRPPCVGLVLGAGGVPAYDFHTGVLAALADAGWDARTAEIIVGTSAGAGNASLLRFGISPADHFARTMGRRASDPGEELIAKLPDIAWDSGDVAPFSWPVPASGPLAVRSLLRWPYRPGLSLAGIAPRGRRSHAPLAVRHGAAHPDWPSSTLWIPCVRLRDGKRVVFGRDDHSPVDVGTAVAASCAIPGVFSPVAIGDHDYVDGGTWSMFNSDLTVGLGLDAVVVSAPLAGPERLTDLVRRPSPGGAYRAYHRNVLDAELRRIRLTGTEVLALEPTAEDLPVLTRRVSDGRPRPDIAQQAYDSVTARLQAEPALRRLLTDAVPV